MGRDRVREGAREYPGYDEGVPRRRRHITDGPDITHPKPIDWRVEHIDGAMWRGYWDTDGRGRLVFVKVEALDDLYGVASTNITTLRAS